MAQRALPGMHNCQQVAPQAVDSLVTGVGACAPTRLCRCRA